jgi:hypothetical protein
MRPGCDAERSKTGMSTSVHRSFLQSSALCDSVARDPHQSADGHTLHRLEQAISESIGVLNEPTFTTPRIVSAIVLRHIDLGDMG